MGLQAALDWGIRDIEVYGDSVLIICQTVGDWKTRDPKWIPYREYLEELTIRFRKITFTYMPRAKKRIRSQMLSQPWLRWSRSQKEPTSIPSRWKQEESQQDQLIRLSQVTYQLR